MITYGFYSVQITSATTFESLAQTYLGDPSYAYVVAEFNGLASIDDARPGDFIRIPIINRRSAAAGNKIFALAEDRDGYGRDIRVDSDGDILASPAGDLEIIGGSGNLNQAILARLSEDVSKRVRLVAYGIRTNLADGVAGNAFVAASVQQTIEADPRVETVNDLQYEGHGDSLKIKASYTDINGKFLSVEGSV